MKQQGYILWAAALKWVMKWWNKLTSWGKPTKWQTSKDYVLIFSFFFLWFRFLSLYSWLRQSLFLLMRFTQISEVVLWNMMLILCRRQNVLRRREFREQVAFVFLSVYFMLWIIFFHVFCFLTGTDANGFPLREEFAKSCFETLLQFSFVNGTSEVDQLAEQSGRNCSSLSYLESDKIVKCATSCCDK